MYVYMHSPAVSNIYSRKLTVDDHALYYAYAAKIKEHIGETPNMLVNK